MASPTPRRKSKYEDPIRMKTSQADCKSRKPGRPITRRIKLPATPEEAARRIFANAKPPDPSLRIFNKPK